MTNGQPKEKGRWCGAGGREKKALWQRRLTLILITRHEQAACGNVNLHKITHN